MRFLIELRMCRLYSSKLRVKYIKLSLISGTPEKLSTYTFSCVARAPMPRVTMTILESQLIRLTIEQRRLCRKGTCSCTAPHRLEREDIARH